MIYIEELIKKYCPNGVEYKSLGEVIEYEQPTKYIVNNTQYDNSYTIPVLTAGQSFILGYTNEEENTYKASKEEPVIIFDDFTTSFHWVDFEFKVKSSAMKILKPNENNNFRFIFYCMKTIKYKPIEHSRQWIEKYSKFKIPLPPIEIQKEIVRILESFTEKTNKLQEILQKENILRKKQYEYYRDELLTFDEDIKNVPLWSVTIWDKKFNSVSKEKQDKVINYPYLLASDLFNMEQENGNVFLLSTGEKTGWTTEKIAGDYLCNGEVVTIPWGKSRKVIDCIKYYKGKFVTADNRIMTSNDINKLNNKFLYYVIMSKGKLIDTFYRGSGIKHPDMSKVLDIQIPLPPLEEQERIVNILDKFDYLCNSITKGIPREIELRKKQYEHYREKLLNFNIEK